jgi:hypothetical protein
MTIGWSSLTVVAVVAAAVALAVVTLVALAIVGPPADRIRCGALRGGS